jgi:hypothetical protein
MEFKRLLHLTLLVASLVLGVAFLSAVIRTLAA